MGLYKLFHTVFAQRGKVRKTFHRELGEPTEPTVILRCTMCDWGADYDRGHGPRLYCPRCGGKLVWGER